MPQMWSKTILKQPLNIPLQIPVEAESAQQAVHKVQEGLRRLVGSEKLPTNLEDTGKSK